MNWQKIGQKLAKNQCFPTCQKDKAGPTYSVTNEFDEGVESGSTLKV